MAVGNFTVLTCLDCGKRLMFELDHVGGSVRLKKLLANGCPCGKQEYVVTNLENYSNAKKLAALPLRKEFKLIHRALRSKLKVIELLKEMMDTCSAEVAKAEMADDVTPLKSVAKWLMAISVTGVQNESDEPAETPEGIGKDKEQQADRAEGSEGDVSSTSS